MKKSMIPDIIAAAPNRRAFVRKLGVASAAVGAAATLGQEKAQAAPENDGPILNFALNLEYLEAEFYTIGLTGQTIAQYGINIYGSGFGGPTTGGRQVPGLNEIFRVTDIVRQLGATERSHVALLRQGISYLGHKRPSLNPQSTWLRWGSASTMSLNSSPSLVF